MSADQLDEFVKILSQFPVTIWNAIVTGGVGWKLMKPFSKQWEFGHFAALFTMLGLNDYQTKGKAETGYWPKVVPLIPCHSDPKEPSELLHYLEPFYSRERMAKDKVNRLKRFLASDICHEIWVGDSLSISANFEKIWRALGHAMGQSPSKKTISFAMKCLARSLLMVNQSTFEYYAIPVPVDSRIRTVSQRLGLPNVSESSERERWRQVLIQIQDSNPKVTMVHLDSLLWQIGTLSPQQMQEHLMQLGAGALAGRISEMFSPIFSIPSSRRRCRI